MINRFAHNNKSTFYFIFRVLVGLMFIQHGFQKLFGAFGGVGQDGRAVELLSLFGLAGIIEFFAGLLIIIGLFASFAAFISAIELLVAYSMVHFQQGFVPIANGGELAVLFFASFLVIWAYGSGKWSIDAIMSKNKKR